MPIYVNLLSTEKFKAISGWTPGQYLIWWRMQLAWSLLNKGESVSQVAEQVGYKSESSFSRAFSKIFSISAGKVRRGKKHKDFYHPTSKTRFFFGLMIIGFYLKMGW